MRDYEFDDEPYVVIDKRSSGVGSFLLGLALGAAAALLMAPHSGAETRRRINTGARRARRAAEDAVGEVTSRVGDTFETARQRVEEKIEETRGAIEVKREQVERAVRAGREAAQQAREELESRLTETKAAYGAGAQVAREARADRAVGRATAAKGRHA
ncbi:MAG: YtxH domain-containing protein [Gemmatimonadaceae bacterium]